MLTVIFTLDYEIYGDGSGSVRDLVLKPSQRLAELFHDFGLQMVVFVEALEFGKMEEYKADDAIDEVQAQLREMRAAGHEIGLHLHPWWARARRKNGDWFLDYSELNICRLAESRSDEIVSSGIEYLRHALGDPDFAPVSFRSGLWAMQPTATMARVLARHGIRVDSSLFKGGVDRKLNLDYRPASNNGHSWRFYKDVNQPDPEGPILEVPIYTEMVPFWRMIGRKRLDIQKRAPARPNGVPLRKTTRDFIRLRYPRKFDFCRMTFDEMRSVLVRATTEAGDDGQEARPVVAIGHSKDLVDFESLRRFLELVCELKARVNTLEEFLLESQSSCECS